MDYVGASLIIENYLHTAAKDLETRCIRVPIFYGAGVWFAKAYYCERKDTAVFKTANLRISFNVIVEISSAFVLFGREKNVGTKYVVHVTY